ncbi:MAG TPA: ABC transporter ATP-binding protein [Conexibacter sp.]|nr:ABC transporter ATP-binding protein [Conexibacter sp.]
MSVTESQDGAPLLEVSELAVVYNLGRRRPPLRAVDGVSMAIAARETVGLVGESGSGKTTIGRAILGLAPVAEGTIAFAGRDITHASYAERRKLADELQVVFQDPYGSLNPTRTVRQTLAESLPERSDAYRTKAEVDERVRVMLERVGMPADAATRYPGHFSGGQRQRIAIARALMASPRLVICDEPTSALDLSVQAQVLNLLRELQRELGLGYLFVSHDLAVVRHLAHRIVVLYRGRVMEQGDAAQVYGSPAHPYTRALVASAPVPDPDAQLERRAARPPRAVELAETSPSSCPFAPRCPHAIDVCRTSRPALDLTPEGSLVACHRWRELRGPELVGADALAAPEQEVS